MLCFENDSNSLAGLRYLKYMKMASSLKAMKPESLHGTKNEVFIENSSLNVKNSQETAELVTFTEDIPIMKNFMFCAYWVYLQLQEWNTLMESTQIQKMRDEGQKMLLWCQV